MAVTASCSATSGKKLMRWQKSGNSRGRSPRGARTAAYDSTANIPGRASETKSGQVQPKRGRVLLRHVRPRHAAAPWPTIAPPRTFVLEPRGAGPAIGRGQQCQRHRWPSSSVKHPIEQSRSSTNLPIVQIRGQRRQPRLSDVHKWQSYFDKSGPPSRISPSFSLLGGDYKASSGLWGFRPHRALDGS